jgi:transcriptional regulator
MDKLSQTALNKLLKGIVGAAISIESIRGTRKLSQNKSDEDLDGVAAALKRRASQQDLDIVARIELVRQRRLTASPPH